MKIRRMVSNSYSETAGAVFFRGWRSYKIKGATERAKMLKIPIFTAWPAVQKT